MKESTYQRKLNEIRKKATRATKSAVRVAGLPGRKTKKVAEATGRAAARGVKKASRSLRASSQKMLDAEEARNRKMINENFGNIEEYKKWRKQNQLRKKLPKSSIKK